MANVLVQKLAGHENLATITDREGFVWCIDGEGRNAALLNAPANLKGSYNWASSRALGQHIDLSLPPSAYENNEDGPQFCEIYHYLALRWRQGVSETPTITTPIEAHLYGADRHGDPMSTHQTLVTALR